MKDPIAATLNPDVARTEALKAAQKLEDQKAAARKAELQRLADQKFFEEQKAFNDQQAALRRIAEQKFFEEQKAAELRALNEKQLQEQRAFEEKARLENQG